MDVRQPRMSIEPPRAAEMSTMSTMSEMTQASAQATPQEIMRQCRLNSRCMIQRFREGPKNAETLPHLIAAYRSVGNSGQARTHMQTYLRRYPSGPKAAEYRRLLDAQR